MAKDPRHSTVISSSDVTIIEAQVPTSASVVPKAVPSLLVIHLAIIAANVFFGGGSVIGFLGLPGVNPILVALIREGIAGPLLCVIAYLIDKLRPNEPCAYCPC